MEKVVTAESAERQKRERKGFLSLPDRIDVGSSLKPLFH